MSLGFNPNRRHRSTNLPGAVNITVVRAPPSARSARIPLEYVSKRRSSVEQTAQPAIAQSTTPTRTASPRPTLNEDETDEHWMYASLTRPIVPRNDADTVPEALQTAPMRVLVVYPMETDAVDGRVSVRVKYAHPVTGQLAYVWVVAYDPNTETRYLTDFSVLP